jgi:protein-tyrosine phosphatase
MCNPQPESAMIDLHSHILYDLDDGALTLAESLAVAQMAAEDGVRVIAATPHGPGSIASRTYAPTIIRERLAALNQALATEGLPIEVVGGTEIPFDAGIIERLRHGALLTYGSSRAILLELAHNTLPPTFETAIFNLQIAGYRIVLAHPERIIEVQQDPNRLLPLIERGVLMQVTAEALTGKQGDRLRSTAETLLTHRMAHLIASDSHGVPPRRSPRLSDARARAAELVGQAAADALVIGTPTAVLYDQPLRLPPPRPVEQRHSRWRRPF